MRYDSLASSYPDSRVGGPGYPFAPEEIFYPSRSTPGYDWKDISPRIGAAYDLFGNGKTAVRFNIGKYMEAITATNNDLDMNPLVRTVVRTTRGWTDTNQELRAGLRSDEPGGQRRMRADGQPEPGAAGIQPQLRPELRRRLGYAALQLGPRPVGPAGSRCPASR